MKKLFYLGLVVFFVGFMHACSLDNNVITPSCTVFETLLVEEWWQPEGGTAPRMKFKADQTLVIEGSNDKISYTLYNCNKIDIENHTQATMDTWIIERLGENDMLIQTDIETKASFKRQAF